jgi:hypothetical protein
MATSERWPAAGREAIGPRAKEQRGFGKVLLEVRRHGLPRTLYDVALKTVNRVGEFKILRGVWIERPDPAFEECPGGYAAGFLTETQIREFARDPESGLSRSFVDAALSKGDECFAFLEGRTLAAYGWYSSRPTRIDPPELLLRFGEQYVYMYNGFTHTRHRGQRLHAIGMTLALRHYLSRGFRGVVSYVESNNFDSLKSCSRMGYTEFGSVYVTRIFGRHLTYSTRGCEQFGFRVERVPPPAPDVRT